MRVQEEAPMLFLTYSLHPGTRAELFPPAQLEDWRARGGNAQNSDAAFEEGAYAGKTPSHS